LLFVERLRVRLERFRHVLRRLQIAGPVHGELEEFLERKNMRAVVQRNSS
jgi:hypothetical protein